MSSLFNFPWQQAFDSSGNTLAGAKLYFYSAGTTTPQNVYSDVGLGVPLSNPVIANGAGRFEPIYLDDTAYKVVLCDADDNLLWTADNIYNQPIDADVSVALAAIRTTTISAGYPEEEADDPTKFVESVYKYANSSNWYEDEGATENAYVLSGIDDYTRPEDYFKGQHIWFISSRANSGASTVNVEAMGQKNIYRADGSALQAGDILGMVHLVFNGTSFLLQEPNILAILEVMYPVGSLFFGTQANCPMAVAIPNSTWTKIATKLTINVNSTVAVKGTGKTLGLTNGSVNAGLVSTNQESNYRLFQESAYNKDVFSTGTYNQTAIGGWGVTTDGTKSGLTGEATVSSITVNVWKRTA